MAASTLSFRWLEILEKEFDKAFVDLDLLLGDIDPDQADLTFDGRQKMTALSAAFAQLCHKAQTIFQTNAKLEAQLLDMRSEMCEVRASRSIMEREVHNTLLQLHAAQLQLHKQAGHEFDSEAIKKKLEDEMGARQQEGVMEAQLEAELKQMKKENEELKQYILAMQGEVYGARLAAKYLDKELAGRHDQGQIVAIFWAQLLDMRSEMCEVRASRSIMEREVHNTLLQLHAAQLQLHKQAGHEFDSEAIKKKLEDEMGARQQEGVMEAQLEAELKQMKKENEELKQYILAMQGEVYGARLAAKYLDKELAGRIQQIQLLGRDMRGPEHDKLWNQLEAEIHLHRHKTVIRACRGRNNNINKKKLPIPPGHDFSSLRKRQGIGDVRTITVHKGNEEGLGMSITGGKEHGVPVLISEIHEGQPAERCAALYVGDAILSVNGIDLKDAKHAEAVEILSQQQGDIELEVVFVAPDEDSDDENNEYEDDNGFRYRMYDPEVASVSSTHSNQPLMANGSPAHFAHSDDNGSTLSLDMNSSAKTNLKPKNRNLKINMDSVIQEEEEGDGEEDKEEKESVDSEKKEQTAMNTNQMKGNITENTLEIDQNDLKKGNTSSSDKNFDILETAKRTKPMSYLKSQPKPPGSPKRVSLEYLDVGSLQAKAAEINQIIPESQSR
ncbi:Golgi-associated PDZ and coiled-coil motif-containing protein [Lingula anatina]|uniref:Golgi-associated PDZ and coiled-coil motif-containing protein n=1 Tax=Lingula anatina TaxID=7574 RepID=A0A1S3HET2_LINAN|nr:Golgi-associated PDZ and coiled-coil motif-containing protein [Lingula anatina]|eukprot:XP_013384582.1 Golgi-associated PDZ and coiled-coil motif-containing protein [Lingula anatina]